MQLIWESVALAGRELITGLLLISLFSGASALTLNCNSNFVMENEMEANEAGML